MAEYISREEAIKELREVYENEYPTASGDFDEYASHDVPNVLRNIPAADVQPVPQWISVKDRLPDEDGWYLVCKHNRVRVAEWCKDCWYNESDLPIDDCAITYWQPLPEPPQDEISLL